MGAGILVANVARMVSHSTTTTAADGWQFWFQVLLASVLYLPWNVGRARV